MRILKLRRGQYPPRVAQLFKELEPGLRLLPHHQYFSKCSSQTLRWGLRICIFRAPLAIMMLTKSEYNTSHHIPLPLLSDEATIRAMGFEGYRKVPPPQPKPPQQNVFLARLLFVKFSPVSHFFDYSQLGTILYKTSLFKVHFCREARPFSESRDAAGGCRQGGLQEEAGSCAVGVGGGVPGGDEKNAPAGGGWNLTHTCTHKKESDRTGEESQSYYSLPQWTCKSDFISLSFSFLICEMALLTEPICS